MAVCFFGVGVAQGEAPSMMGVCCMCQRVKQRCAWTKMGDHVFLVRLVKYGVLFVRLWCVAWVLLCGVGCVPRVRLPDPKPFVEEEKIGDGVYRALLLRGYGQSRAEVWDRFAACWDVKRAWGRLLYQVDLIPGQIPRCTLVRMTLRYQELHPTAGWKKLFALQRDRLFTAQDAYKFSTQVAQERKLLRRACAQECPFALPQYTGSYRGPMRFLMTREPSELPPDQQSPPPPRRLPPTKTEVSR